MSYQFSINTIFRMTPVRFLCGFFDKIGIDMQIDWKNIRDIKPIQAAYQMLSETDRQRSENILKRITALACKEGLCAINEAARIVGPRQWDASHKLNATLYQKIIWTWTVHPKLIDKALEIFQVNKIKYSYKLEGLPTAEPEINEAMLLRLKREMQSLFLEKESRGDVCTVEVLRKGNGQYCFFVFPNDYERAVLKHDENEQLYGAREQSVFEIVFALDCNTGILELACDVNKAMQEELVRVFLATVYGIEPPPQHEPTYDMSVLKNRNFPLKTDPYDSISVEISLLCIKWDKTGRTTSFGVPRKDSVFASIDDFFRKEKRNLKEGMVTHAALRFRFHPKPDRRAGVLSADITSATNCNINSKDKQRVDLINKYLELWGIKK